MKNAIVRIDVLDGSGNRLDWGTGFLAGPRLILTAYHVVADRKEARWSCRGERLEAAFGDNIDSPISVHCHSIDSDRGLDFAALELMADAPDTVRPIPLAAGSAAAGADFHSWGFARLNASNGFAVTGKVADSSARVEDRQPALQLYAREASAPDAEFRGLSGSPCIVGDVAFGVVRCFPTVNGATVAGATIYACPTSSIVGRPNLIGKLAVASAKDPPTVAFIVPGYDDCAVRLKAAFESAPPWRGAHIVEEDPVRAVFHFRDEAGTQRGIRSVFFIDFQSRYDTNSYLEMIREVRAVGRALKYKPIFVLMGDYQYFEAGLRPTERAALEKYYRLPTGTLDSQVMHVLGLKCLEEWRLRPQSGSGSL